MSKLKQVTDKEKASWVTMSMDIEANEMFGRDYRELDKRHQVSVIEQMIMNRDFKGL